jgi:hypothetical protein
VDEYRREEVLLQHPINFDPSSMNKSGMICSSYGFSDAEDVYMRGSELQSLAPVTASCRT